MTLAAIPFSVPAQLMADVASGNLVRYGAVLKDPATGRIVAHLQETGAFSEVLSRALPAAGNLVSSGGPLSVLMEGVSLYQNHQIGRKIDALSGMINSLQSLTLVGSVASIAGVGVTVASTALLMQRFHVINENIQSLKEKVDGIPKEIRDQKVNSLITTLDTHLERIEEAPFRTMAGALETELSAAENALHFVFAELHALAMQTARLPLIDADLLRTLLGGLAVAGATQIKSLVWLDDLAGAQKRSEAQAKKLFQLSELLPQDILRTCTGADPNLSAQLGIELADLRATAATRPAFLENLQRLEISGPRYLAEMEERDDVPVLALASG